MTNIGSWISFFASAPKYSVCDPPLLSVMVSEFSASSALSPDAWTFAGPETSGLARTNLPAAFDFSQ